MGGYSEIFKQSIKLNEMKECKCGASDYLDCVCSYELNTTNSCEVDNGDECTACDG